MPPLYRYQPEKRARLHRRGDRVRALRAEATALRKEVLHLRAQVVISRHALIHRRLKADMDAAEESQKTKTAKLLRSVIWFLIGWALGWFWHRMKA